MQSTKTATLEQIMVAKEFHIPVKQAHTINLEKVEAYRVFKTTPAEQINDYLDRGIR